MDKKRKIRKYYEIGDKLVAIKRFLLEDIYGKEYYYNVGDEFIIMKVHHQPSIHIGFSDSLEFQLNTVDSVFEWGVYYDELEDFKTLLVRKKDYIKIIRKQKLEQLNENSEEKRNNKVI